MNPWLLLAQAGATVALLVGAWVCRGHIDQASCKADKEAMQLDAAKKEESFKAQASGIQDIAAAHEKEVTYDYQKRLQALEASNASALDTSKRLRDAIAIYATQPNPSGLSEASCIPISEANQRAGRLADVASELDAEGLKASRDAASCAVKLTACESWASTVEGMFSARP